MTFYEKVNALCLERGTSITAVATALGYSQSAPTTWKNSKGLPRANTIKKLSEYFGVPVSYFTDGSTTIHDNHGVIGNTHAPVTINNGSVELSEIEKELLSICGKLDMKRKNALLSKAYELLEDKS